MKMYWRSEGIAPRMGVVSFTSWGKEAPYQLNRRLGGPQSQCGYYGKERKSHLALLGIDTWSSSPQPILYTD
jgi:hypothetical protein